MDMRPTLLKLFGEEPFLPERDTFAIGRAPVAYTLQFSVDCENAGDTNAHWTDYYGTEIPADTEVFIVRRGRVWWRLKNNTGKFVVRF